MPSIYTKSFGGKIWRNLHSVSPGNNFEHQINGVSREQFFVPKKLFEGYPSKSPPNDTKYTTSYTFLVRKKTKCQLKVLFCRPKILRYDVHKCFLVVYEVMYFFNISKCDKLNYNKIFESSLFQAPRDTRRACL